MLHRVPLEVSAGKLLNTGCGWCASSSLPDRGTVARTVVVRLSLRVLGCTKTSTTTTSTPHDVSIDGSHKAADVPASILAFLTNAFLIVGDTTRHSCFAMDNNPLHTTASAGNLGPVFLGLDWAIFSLSTITVAIRLYTRLYITRNFGLDDATMALTQARHLASKLTDTR